MIELDFILIFLKVHIKKSYFILKMEIVSFRESIYSKGKNPPLIVDIHPETNF